MSMFRVHTITGTRYAASTVLKGQSTPGATSAIGFTSSVQPMSGKEKLSLPEGVREKTIYKLYTSFALRTASEKNKTKADRVTVFGDLFEVIKVDTWQNKVIPHYKALVSSIDA